MNQITRYCKLPVTSYGTPYINLINKTGAASVAGTLVSADATLSRGVRIPVNPYDICGVIVESGKADGANVKVVTGGICEILIENGTTVGFAGWIRASSNQYGTGINTTDPAGLGAISADEHVKEIGHALGRVASGGVGNKALIFLHTL